MGKNMGWGAQWDKREGRGWLEGDERRRGKCRPEAKGKAKYGGVSGLKTFRLRGKLPWFLGHMVTVADGEGARRSGDSALGRSGGATGTCGAGGRVAQGGRWWAHGLRPRMGKVLDCSGRPEVGRGGSSTVRN